MQVLIIYLTKLTKKSDILKTKEKLEFLDTILFMIIVMHCLTHDHNHLKHDFSAIGIKMSPNPVPIYPTHGVYWHIFSLEKCIFLQLGIQAVCWYHLFTLCTQEESIRCNDIPIIILYLT